MPWKRILVLIAVAALGCEPRATYQFRVVDSETGKPLEHVRVTEGWQGAHWHNRLFDDSGYDELKPTDANGATTATGVIQDEDFQYHFWFESGGYKFLVATDGGSSDPWIFTYADAPLGLVGLKTVNTWVAKNSEIRVPMYRREAATTQK